MQRLGLLTTLVMVSLLVLSSTSLLSITTVKAAAIPYYDYSRSDWGANPNYDATHFVTTATTRPFKVTSYDLDTGRIYYPTIYPGQLIYSPKPPQTPTGIAIHDTETSNNVSCDVATSASIMRSIQEYHAVGTYSHVAYGPTNPDPKHEINNRGVLDGTFGDVGYHLLIDCAGHIFEGRAGGIYQEGAHIHRHNSGLIGIALLGSFEYQQPTPAQHAALIKLLTRLCQDLNINPLGIWQQTLLDGSTETLHKNGKPVLNIAGHIDFPDNDHTDPGVLDLDAVRREVATNLAGTATVVVPTNEFFPQTGQTLAEPFLSFWKERGALPIFGYPLTPVFSEFSSSDQKTYLVQYFERARFELHPELANTPYYIQLGRLGVNGATRAKSKYPQPFQPLTGPPDPKIYYFKESGHTLANGFFSYWNANGGLAIFGLPLSEEFAEEDGQGHTYTVQYFERARFEYHPNAPPAYSVLLGRLGADNLPVQIKVPT
jgi:hypothetical protein